MKELIDEVLNNGMEVINKKEDMEIVKVKKSKPELSRIVDTGVKVKVKGGINKKMIKREEDLKTGAKLLWWLRTGETSNPTTLPPIKISELNLNKKIIELKKFSRKKK